MGCNISAHPKISPRLPAVKPPKLAAKNTAETSQYDLGSRKASLGASSVFLQREPSLKGQSDSKRPDSRPDSQQSVEKPNANENKEAETPKAEESATEEAESNQEAVPVYIRSPKRDFTFSPKQAQPMNSYNEQPNTNNKPMSHFRRTSELFGDRMSPARNLLKLSVNTGTQNQLDSELHVQSFIDRKGSIKITAEFKSSPPSMHIADQEGHPDTPGFKPINTHYAHQKPVTTGSALNRQHLPHLKSRLSQQFSNSESDSRGTPFSPKSDDLSQIQAFGSGFQGLDHKASQHLPYLKSKLSQQFSKAESDSRPPPFSPKKFSDDLSQMQAHASESQGLGHKVGQSFINVFQSPSQEQLELKIKSQTPKGGRGWRFQQSLTHNSNDENTEKEVEQKASQPEKQETAKPQKAQLKKMFTQNLLDLVVPKRETPPPIPAKMPDRVDRPDKELNLAPMLELDKRLSTDPAEDASLWLILNTHFGTGTGTGGTVTRKGSEDHRESKADVLENNEKMNPKRKSRLGPLKFANIDLFNNGDMISPINHIAGKNYGSITPFSYQESFMRGEFNSSEVLDERTITNAENISRGDFEKYSFMAEVKEIEWEEQSSLNNSPKQRQSIKKSRFNNNEQKLKVPGSSNIFEEEQEKNPSIQLDITPKKGTRHKASLDFREEDSSLFLSPKHVGSHPPPFIRNMSLVNENQENQKPKSFQVIETNSLDKSVDDNGCKKVNQYTMFHQLGKGTFAKVKLAVDWKDGVRNEYAIKIASKNKLKRKLFTQQKNAFTQLQTEIAIMKKLSHPNLIQLFEVIDVPEEDKLYLVMEYAARGAVMSRRYWDSEIDESPQPDESPFRRARNLTEEKAKKYFRDLIMGIHYMHIHLNTVHRDIKPENLLITQHDVLKIADFNVSQMFENNCDVVQDNLGTKLFLAPEAWANTAFRGKPADIWAAGATLYYFLFGKPPFQDKFGQDIKEMILNNQPQFPEEKAVDPKAIDLIKACLVKNPEKRLRIEELVNHPWVTDNGGHPLSIQEFDASISVNSEELATALTVNLKTALMISARLVKSLSSVRVNLLKKQKTK